MQCENLRFLRHLETRSLPEVVDEYHRLRVTNSGDWPVNRGNILPTLFERKGVGKKLAMQLLWNKRAGTASPRSGLVQPGCSSERAGCATVPGRAPLAARH